MPLLSRAEEEEEEDDEEEEEEDEVNDEEEAEVEGSKYGNTSPGLKGEIGVVGTLVERRP